MHFVPAVGGCLRFSLSVTLMLGWAEGWAHANPYLARPREATVKTRIGTCAVTGGFMHLYTALDNAVFSGNSGAARCLSALKR